MGFFKDIGNFVMAAIPGVGQYMGGKETASSARDVGAMQVGSTREQMAFQERMSSTAFQRATADMRAAGINPMMAADQGGASTPAGANVGSLPVPESPMKGVSEDIQNKVMSFVAMKQGLASTAKTMAEAERQDLENKFIKSDPKDYFRAKQGVSGVIPKITDSLTSSAKSIKEGWKAKSFPNLLELFTGPGYITDSEMRKRGRARLKSRGATGSY